MATSVPNNPFDTQPPAPENQNPAFQATQYKPQTLEVNRATETAAGQLESLLSKDSPLMQRSRTLALQQMGKRGLINSSMAIGASQAAMVERANPIAQQDAQIYSDRALANMNATNTAAQFNAGEQNKFGLQSQEQAFTFEQNKATRDFQAAQAELDRAQQVALADKSIEAQQALQKAQQTFQAAESALERAQENALQESQQQFQASEGLINRQFQAEQAGLDRSQQMTVLQAQQNFQAAQSELDRAQQVALADKSIAAQQALQKAQQDFAAAEAALERTQQEKLQNAQQNFQAAQSQLDRAQQIVLADKSLSAQQTLQVAQQEFQAAQAALDRAQQSSLADRNLAGQLALQTAQLNAAAASQAASQAFTTSQTSLQIASNNSQNASAFISRTIESANASINAVLANGDLDEAAKRGQIDNIVKNANSSLQWAATFYNTKVPTYTAPGGTSTTITPGPNAGGGNAQTEQASVQGLRDAIMGAGSDMTRGTQLGLAYLNRLGVTPQQGLAMWNAAMGTNFTMADYYRVTGNSSESTSSSNDTAATTTSDTSSNTSANTSNNTSNNTSSNTGSTTQGGIVNSNVARATTSELRDVIMSAGGDMTRGTELGLDYLTDLGVSPEEGLAMWNEAMGTNFTMRDYVRATAGRNSQP